MCKSVAESQKSNKVRQEISQGGIAQGEMGAMGSLGNLLPAALRGGRSPAVAVIAVIKVNHILPLAYMTFFSLYMRTEMNFLAVFKDDDFKDFTGGLVTHFSF